MPDLRLSVPHQFDKSVAAEKLQSFSSVIREKYGDHVSDLRESWDGSTLNYGFCIKGFNVSGKVDVHDDHVELDTKLPLAAMIIKGRIEKEIRVALVAALA